MLMKTWDADGPIEYSFAGPFSCMVSPYGQLLADL
uniref:Uncharacterized protein n=1 Tax=Romanomermis culicivorax TaxID=13658 RepID=A0A915L8V1_ROMCU